MTRKFRLKRNLVISRSESIEIYGGRKRKNRSRALAFVEAFPAPTLDRTLGNSLGLNAGILVPLVLILAAL